MIPEAKKKENPSIIWNSRLRENVSEVGLWYNGLKIRIARKGGKEEDGAKRCMNT